MRLRRGVYVAAERLAEHEAAGRRHQVDCLAVLLALDRPTAALSHGTVVRLRGLPVPRGLPPVVRLTDPGQWRRGRGWAMTAAPLDAVDLTTSGPFRLTTTARALVDAAREWTLEQAVVAMDAALLRKRTSATELVRVAEMQHHWPGAPRAQRAVSLTDGRAESPLETRGRLRILGADLPPFDLQREIWADGRMVAVADLWFDDAAVLVEFDGQVKYTDPWRDPGRVLWDEKRREDTVRALDVGVVRVVAADLTGGWPALEARLRDLTSRPGPVGRRFTTVPRTEGVVRSAGRTR